MKDSLKNFLKGEFIVKKLLNNKGFSLVELIVVVALMGILLLIAIPSYTSYKKKTESDACNSNIEIIKLAIVDFYASEQTYPDSIDDLKPYLDDGVIPVCPKSKDKVYNYGIAAKKTPHNSWAGIVVCSCKDDGHKPENADTSFPTGNTEGSCYVLQNPTVA